MICSNCGLEIASEQAVELNGEPLHVEACFAAGLRRLSHVAIEPLVQLSTTMQPAVAYKAGKTFVATVIAKRRRSKAPAQQSFSASSFGRKQR